MKFSTEMEAELVRLIELNWDSIHTSSKTYDALNSIRKGWNAVVSGMNSGFPLNQVNEEQARNKWKKLVARNKDLAREKKRLEFFLLFKKQMMKNGRIRDKIFSKLLKKVQKQEKLFKTEIK
jgi:hypothetical protein